MKQHFAGGNIGAIFYPLLSKMHPSLCISSSLIMDFPWPEPALSQEQDVDHLRGKVATETLKELQKQVAAAAQAIAAAREATMTLDKVWCMSFINMWLY